MRVGTIEEHGDRTTVPIPDLYAWVGVNSDGGEGVFLADPIGEMGMPTVNPALWVTQHAGRPLMVQAAGMMGMEIRLVRFTRAEVVEVVHPAPLAEWLEGG